MWPVIVVLVALVASWMFWLVALGCSLHALAPRDPAGRAGRAGRAAWLPAVSLLKPVCGLDCEARANFVSHCEQRYPSFEVVFGVADPRDPAVALVEELQARYGRDRVRLVVARDEAPNPKAGLLDRLAREARHDVLVATDSDVRVRPDFLTRAVARLAEPGIGLVTLPYRGEHALGFAAVLEALGIETAFVPSAIVGHHVLRARFALGAANALRRDTLDRIGGFRAVANHLADDYQLGLRVAATGERVAIGDSVVASVLGRTSIADWWRREVRWARAIRTSRPRQYPGLLLTFSTPLGLLGLIAGAGWLPLAGSLLVRWHVGWQMTRCMQHRALRRWLWLLPVRDLLAAAIWLAGLVGHTVHWRGRTFAIARDGQLRPVCSAGAIARGARRLDRYLRRRHGIFEFTDDPTCILRLAIGRGERGEPVGELHLWNEQLPTREGIGWGLDLRARLTRSLALLARSVEDSAALAELPVLAAEISLSAGYAVARLDAMARRFGLHATACPHRGGPWHRLHAWLMRRAFPGPAVRGGGLQRIRFWITRDELRALHLPPVGRGHRGSQA